MIASILDHDDVHFEHKGLEYAIHRLGAEEWSVSTQLGEPVGTLIVVASEGEEHEPVYGGVMAGRTETDYEGSDWESIVRGLVNEALEAHSDEATPQP